MSQQRREFPSADAMAVMIKEDVYLTTADALAYLRTAPRTLYRFLATGKIPAVRIGRQWRFRKADLDRWVEHHVTAATLRGRRVPLVAETQRDGEPLAGLPGIGHKKAERVLIGPDEMGYQVLMRRAVVENLNMLGGLDEDARMRRAEDRRAKKQESRSIAPGSFDA